MTMVSELTEVPRPCGNTALDAPSIEVSTTGEGTRHVRILKPQRGSSYSNVSEFETDWPQELLFDLARLKGDWFLDSYQRFEHPNYIQKQVDTVLDLYGISLRDTPVLDFGCGFGASTYCMIKRSANQIVAADLDENNTGFASRFLAGKGISQFATVLHDDVVPTLQSGTLGVIWLQAVMEHLLPEERERYLRRFWDALRPQGWLIITETPNRLWPVERHTTGGTWWIPWMKPSRVFRKMRKVAKYNGYDDDDFYQSGIIGSSYGEILNCLGRPNDCRQAAVERSGYVKHVYSRAAKRSVGRRIAASMLGVADLAARTCFRRPITAFMPFLQHLAFQKK